MLRTLLCLPLVALTAAPGPGPAPTGFDPAADHLHAARSALASGETERALELLRAARRLAPGEAEPRLLLVRCLNDAGRSAEALRLLSEDAPPSAWLATEAGRAQLALGEAGAAEESFRAALGTYPDCGSARYLLTGLLLEDGRLPEAHTLFEPLLAAAPDLPAVQLLRARLAEAAGDPGDAIALLEESLAAGADSPELRLQLATRLCDAGRAPEAWARVAELSGASREPALLLSVARIGRAAGRHVEALALVGAGLVIAPDDPGLLAELAALLEEQASLRGLVAERRLEAEPDSLAAWCELLEARLAAGLHGDALALCALVPAEVARDSRILLLEATALRRAGRGAECRALLEECCARAAGPQASYELALLDFAEGRVEAAQAGFDSAAHAGDAELAPDAHYNRGLCLDRLGRHAEAAEAYRAAARLRAGFVEAWLQLGLACRHRLGDSVGAREAFEHYLHLGGDDPLVRRWMGAQ